MSDEAKIETTRTSVKTIHESVKMFYIQNSKLPDSLEDLISEDFKGGPFLESLDPDVWGNDYILRGETRNDFEVISAGPDGNEDSEDDISSRKKRE